MMFEPKTPLRRRISPLTLKILAVNISTVLILAFGFIYSAQYEQQLIASELSSLEKEAELISTAISEGGIRISAEAQTPLAPDLSQLLVRQLSETTGTRIIVYDDVGSLVADSHQLYGAGGLIEIDDISPPRHMLPFNQKIASTTVGALKKLPTGLKLPQLPTIDPTDITSIHGVVEAAEGEGESHLSAWFDAQGHIALTAAMPISRLKQVIGSVLIIRQDSRISDAISAVQYTTLKIFLGVLLLTVLVSTYLATRIATPLFKLARATDKIRFQQGQPEDIPNYSHRKDEVGDLSTSLRTMTLTLNERLNAIESFAADVAHELKNPLASLRSAIETLPKVEDSYTQKKLMRVIEDDVGRLDRLISDISAASRIDAQLSRQEREPLKLKEFFQNLIAGYESRTDIKNSIILNSSLVSNETEIFANSTRIGQVFSNLIDNALSFAEEDTAIHIGLWREDGGLYASVENIGPPIPENKLEHIFDRFYSERPSVEKFGQHSGLGLSIAKQIIEAHNASIHVENRTDAPTGKNRTCFIIAFKTEAIF